MSKILRTFSSSLTVALFEIPTLRAAFDAFSNIEGVKNARPLGLDSVITEFRRKKESSIRIVHGYGEREMVYHAVDVTCRKK